MAPSVESRSPSAPPESAGEGTHSSGATFPAGLDRVRMLEHLTDNTGRPVLYLNATFHVLFVNKPFQAWIGQAEADIVGRHAADVFPKEAFQFYEPYLWRALAGEATQVETISRARPANPRHIRVSFFPDAQHEGVIAGIFILSQDIEEDFQLRQRLVDKEREIRSIADNIGMPLSKSDRSLRYTYVNRVACEWFGRTEVQIIGRTWTEVIGEAQYAEIADYVSRVLSGESVTYERSAKFSGRARGQVRVNMFPDVAATGEVIGVLVAIADVDQDFRLRQEIINRERQIRLIMDGIGLPISYISADRLVRFYNRTGEEWTGITEESVIGKIVEEAFGDQVVNAVRPYLEKGFAGERTTYERLANFPGRGTRWIRGHIVPDKTDDAKVAGIYTVLTDINDDVVLRENLREQERQLRLFTDNIPEAIAYLDVNRCYTFVNNTFLRHNGRRREETIGRTSAEVLGVEAAQLGDPFVARALAGETVTYERPVTHADGQRRWFRIRTVPDKARDGTVQGLYVVGMDIHDIKLAQAVLETSEAELRNAMDALPHPMAYMDRQYCYRLMNQRVETLLGKTRDELIGKSFQDNFGEAYFLQLKPYWDRALAGETVTVERMMGSDPAARRWMTVRYTPRIDSVGEIIGFYAVATDIDTLKRAELDLRRANWLLSSHFENTPLAVIEWDEEFRVRRWSPQAEKIFGWTESDVKGRRHRDWPFVVESDLPVADAVINKLTTNLEPRTTSLHRNYRKDGEIIWCEWYNSSLFDEAGKVVSVLSLAQDVTNRVQAEQRLVYQATHDSLTGLPNRTMLQDRLRHAIARARRAGHHVAAMFIDLDRFKEVNDTLGHRIGDTLLCEMAKRLNHVVRDSDILVRLSGDEFMVVLEQVTDADSPAIVANKLLEAIRMPLHIEGHDIHVSGSIGVSLFPDDASDADTLLKNADMAMYRAKELGKNTFQLFSSDLAERGTAARVLENALRVAVGRREFELYYQPKVEIATGRIVGAEALLRWHHPSRGLVVPGEFIALAEETGLIHEIGAWVLDEACLQLSRWHTSGFGEIHLAINVAAGQLRGADFATRVHACVLRAGCLPQFLEVEVTETSMLLDPEGVGRTLEQLREFGVRVAIDDFGTGYSSLSHLKRFPIDILKIDKTFVADILTERDDTAIVSAVIALARALDMEVVAEGVETEAQRVLLASNGCDAYQGYLFSKPLPAAEFEALLARNISAWRGGTGSATTTG